MQRDFTLRSSIRNFQSLVALAVLLLSLDFSVSLELARRLLGLDSAASRHLDIPKKDKALGSLTRY